MIFSSTRQTAQPRRYGNRAMLLAAALCTSLSSSLSTAAESQTALEGFFDTYKAAELHDPRLRKALRSHQAEQEEANIRFGALLPDIRATGNYQYEDSDNIYTDEDSSFYNEGQSRSGGQLIDHSWTVSIRQPLFDYPAVEDYRSSKALVKASSYSYQREQQELIYRVSEHYLKVLLAAQQVYLNQQKLEALELKRSQVERAKELQVSDQLSLLHAKANRDIAKSDLLQAKSNLTDAKTLLSNITGRATQLPEHWANISYHVNPDLIAGTMEEWLKNVSNNMNVKAAHARTVMEQRSLLARKADHLPRVSLNLSHRDRQSEDEFRTRTDSIASVEVTMPLYSGGRVQAGARKAKARLLASQAELDYVRAEKEQQVKLSYNRLSAFKERLSALAESRESSKGYLEAAERQQSLKLNDQVTVLEARTQLLDTQIQFAKTLNDYLLADLILRLETGSLDQKRLHDYDQLFGLIKPQTKNENNAES